MAYNPYFPASYPYYQYPAMPEQTQAVTRQQNAQTGIIWVQGEAGAKAYPIAPNTTVQLWDSEAQVIYLKSADVSGMPSMKVLDYSVRESTQNSVSAPKTADLSGYVTKEEFESRLAEIMRGDTHGKSAVRTDERNTRK